jgi:hypothetical protein
MRSILEVWKWQLTNSHLTYFLLWEYQVSHILFKIFKVKPLCPFLFCTIKKVLNEQGHQHATISIRQPCKNGEITSWASRNFRYRATTADRLLVCPWTLRGVLMLERPPLWSALQNVASGGAFGSFRPNDLLVSKLTSEKMSKRLFWADLCAFCFKVC